MHVNMLCIKEYAPEADNRLQKMTSYKTTAMKDIVGAHILIMKGSC